MEHCKSVKFFQFLEFQATLHKRKAPYWRLSGDGSDNIHKRMLGLIGSIRANQYSLQRNVTMQERHLCWPAYFFPWPRSGQFFHLELPLNSVLVSVSRCNS